MIKWIKSIFNGPNLCDSCPIEFEKTLPPPPAKTCETGHHVYTGKWKNTTYFRRRYCDKCNWMDEYML